jgi:hypothetical protein
VITPSSVVSAGANAGGTAGATAADIAYSDDRTAHGGGGGTQTGGGSLGLGDPRRFSASGNSCRLGFGGIGGYNDDNGSGAGAGAGGGGYYGGGGGGLLLPTTADDRFAAAGGGGGSSLVPTGGTFALATTSPMVTITYAVPDRFAPSISISTPTEGGGSIFEAGSSVNANYWCTDEDGGSGVATCVGTVPSGSLIDTAFGNHTFTVTATDVAGNTSTKTAPYAAIDTTNPSVSIASPIDGATFALGQQVNAAYSCTDGGSGIASCTGPVAAGSPIDTSTAGAHSFKVTATDNVGYSSSATSSYTVTNTFTFTFTGFFSPVDNTPTLNVTKAGSAIPVKFGLGGDKGLNVLAANSPASGPVQCGGTADTIEQTVTAGNSSLSYNATTQQYTYTWKTDKSWAGTCRQFVLKLKDGTSYPANFQFK